MILFKLWKNNNAAIKEAYGKWYATPVITQTIGLSGLAEHMSEHNTGFSRGAVKGLLTDMVRCIKELVLQGSAVKIDDLAIFSIGIRSKKGADSEKDFSVAKNIEGVKLRSRATGDFANSKLDLVASLKNASTLISDSSTDGTTDDGGDDDGGGSSQSGTSSGGSGSSASGGSGSSSGSGTSSGGSDSDYE